MDWVLGIDTDLPSQSAERTLDGRRRTCRIGRLPRRYRGRDAFVWLHESGFYDAPPDVLADPSERFRSAHWPQIGSGRTVSLAPCCWVA